MHEHQYAADLVGWIPGTNRLAVGNCRTLGSCRLPTVLNHGIRWSLACGEDTWTRNFPAQRLCSSSYPNHSFDDTEVTAEQSASYPIRVLSRRRCPDDQTVAKVPSVDGSGIMIVSKQMLIIEWTVADYLTPH
jgi:hypothetical protein